MNRGYIKRSFDVSADQVFDAWLNPEMMRKWLFTMETTNKVAKNEPHVGGTWEIVDHRGGKDYRAIGEYIEIDPPRRFVFTFRLPQFSDTEDKTAPCSVLSCSFSSFLCAKDHLMRDESSRGLYYVSISISISSKAKLRLLPCVSIPSEVVTPPSKAR